ncbi:zinc finger AN1 domain-containing stress-associated protein 15-like [Dioscorea cayenensis subsp. rotundata]|uniref:Zinc finger AN1 domain-containing stress-associated protein 15-like n=1 Tax=Dioscorea cayennensis subsp. rotundata TaxID=55577 RepID=A0AB40ARU6_DIOCR|nr:zinc finger AN1 domain-containing stress-associated protein 15-like [Dioscorea cayenensis subsp. rotundata]
MARESCNLDKDEAEILKPTSSPTAPSPAPPTTPPPSSLFLKPSSQEFQSQRPERQEVATAVAGTSQKSDDKPTVRFANRCSSCRKRVGLTGFRCRCGDLFCPRHRYSEFHDCSFDYKAAGREEISKANPVIRPSKIIKI